LPFGQACFGDLVLNSEGVGWVDTGWKPVLRDGVGRGEEHWCLEGTSATRAGWGCGHLVARGGLLLRDRRRHACGKGCWRWIWMGRCSGLTGWSRRRTVERCGLRERRARW